MVVPVQSIAVIMPPPLVQEVPVPAGEEGVGIQSPNNDVLTVDEAVNKSSSPIADSNVKRTFHLGPSDSPEVRSEEHTS